MSAKLRKFGERIRPECWFRRPAETNFTNHRAWDDGRWIERRKVRLGETPKPALGTSALPRGASRDLMHDHSLV